VRVRVEVHAVHRARADVRARVEEIDREPLRGRMQAVLAWLAAHPWVDVVTTDDLTDDDVVGELDLVRASDPYVEEQWRLPRPAADGHDNGLAYDTWYAAWAATPAAWLGESLRAVSDRAEQAIERAKAASSDDSDELLLLARLYWLMCLHESQWSKRPRIEPGSEGFDHCENFVAAPKHKGKSPVASGSSVPVCPAFSARNRRLTFCNASLLDRPKGLSSRSTPCTARRTIGVRAALAGRPAGRAILVDEGICVEGRRSGSTLIIQSSLARVALA